MQTSPQWSQEICKNKMPARGIMWFGNPKVALLDGKGFIFRNPGQQRSQDPRAYQQRVASSDLNKYSILMFWRACWDLLVFFIVSNSSLSAMSFDSLKIFLFLCATCCEDSTKAHAMAQLPPIFLCRCSGDLQWLGCIMFYLRAFWRFCCPTFSKTWSNFLQHPDWLNDQ